MTAILNFMGEIDGFKSYFVKDLQQRAKHTLEKAAANNFEQVGEFKLKKLRKVMEGKPLLDPLNLLYLGNAIFDLGYVNASDMPETTKSMLDLYLSYVLVFTQSDEFYPNLELLKLVMK